MIIQILGAPGSGKSRLVRDILEANPCSPIYDGKGRVCALLIAEPTRFYVLGNYEGKACGAQIFKDRCEIVEGLRGLAACGPVVFEGIELEPSEYAELSRNAGPGGLVFAFLDTPLEDCIAHSGAWNEKQKEFIRSERQRLMNLSREMLTLVGVRILDHSDAPANLLRILQEFPVANARQSVALQR
jgi:hypothetical protein